MSSGTPDSIGMSTYLDSTQCARCGSEYARVRRESSTDEEQGPAPGVQVSLISLFDERCFESSTRTFDGHAHYLALPSHWICSLSFAPGVDGQRYSRRYSRSWLYAYPIEAVKQPYIIYEEGFEVDAFLGALRGGQRRGGVQ